MEDVKEAQASMPDVDENQQTRASSEEKKPEIAPPKKLMRVMSQQKEQQPQPSALAEKEEKPDAQRESKPASLYILNMCMFLNYVRLDVELKRYS